MLQEVTGGYKGSQEVTRGTRGFKDFRGLQQVTRGYRGY